MARFGGTCHAQRNVSSGELVNHALLLSLLAMLATPSGLVWPDGSLQDHGGEETARKRNYQACLYGLATCQLASLSPTERQAVNEAAKKQNYQACLSGLVTCQLASLSPMERQAVKEAAKKQNYQACLYGLVTCQLASLSPTERQAVKEAAKKQNYQACLYGLVTCQLASLSPTERQAVKEAAEKRARALMAVPPVAGRSFKGYACTVDCSGHEAGYQWAEDNGIDDESDCTGNSQSFIEGCIAYVEENSDDGYGLTEDDEEYNEDEGEDSDDN